MFSVFVSSTFETDSIDFSFVGSPEKKIRKALKDWQAEVSSDLRGEVIVAVDVPVVLPYEGTEGLGQLPNLQPVEFSNLHRNN